METTIRCGDCNRLLVKVKEQFLTLKCPRCKGITLVNKRDMIPDPEGQSAPGNQQNEHQTPARRE